MTDPATIAAGLSEVQRRALYFGCWLNAGHYLHAAGGRHIDERKLRAEGFPWNMGHLDTGLLKNGKHPDRCDGKVFWTCGGKPDLWFAFFWWDRSVDSRAGSNSGFYVRGFEFPHAQAAFDYACTAFPSVITRQKFPLILQDKLPAPVRQHIQETSNVD